MNFSKLVVLTILPAMFLMACVSTNKQGNKILNEQAFKNKLQQESAVLLDVRTPEEYKAGHLKNAVLLDYNGGVFDTSFQKLDKEKTYLIYCRSGKRSDNAATKMKQAGFKKIYQLNGGITAWKGDIEKQ
jgi:rhodanese-related sulfurtransferase